MFSAFFLRVVSYIRENKNNFLIFFSILLSGIIGFEAGILKGASFATPPIIIEPACQGVVAGAESGEEKKVSDQNIEKKNNPSTSIKDCVFVGSKNSNLYHLPTCSSAKRIKEENKVCFSSKEDAEKKGYKPGCLK